MAINGTGGAEEGPGIRNLGPWRAAWKSIKHAGFPEAPTPCAMPGLVSHTSCGKRHVLVCSMLCFFSVDGLLRSTYNFFRDDLCDPQKIMFSEKKEKELSLGPLVPVQSTFLKAERIQVWN